MKKFYFVLLVLTLYHITTSNKLIGQTYIQAQTGYYTNESHYSWQEEWYKINDSLMANWSCCGISDTIKFAIFDSINCAPWKSIGTGSFYYDIYDAFHYIMIFYVQFIFTVFFQDCFNTNST